jgi:hypothetical protein
LAKEILGRLRGDEDEEERTKKKVWFFIFILGVLQIGEVVGMRLVDLCLKGKYETIRCAMYFERHNIYLRIGFDG